MAAKKYPHKRAIPVEQRQCLKERGLAWWTEDGRQKLRRGIGRPLTPLPLGKILLWHKQGKSVQGIANELNISSSAVQRVLSL